MIFSKLLAGTCVAVLAASGAVASDEARTTAGFSAMMEQKMAIKREYFGKKRDGMDAMMAERPPPSGTGPFPCTNGLAGGFFPCKDIDVLGITSLSDLGVQGNFLGSDIWGWVDPQTGKEYALTTAMDGCTIVDVSTPTAPKPLFRMNTLVPANSRSYWRDVKTYKNVAYFVADALSNHGMQVFNLERVRNPPSSLATVSADFVYRGFGQAHNIVINEDTGFAYAVGGDSCSGGLHVMDLKKNPLRPEFVGCWSVDGYVHDAQCIVYDGPDTRFTGKEICFGYNEDTLAVLDVTDKTTDSRGELVNVNILYNQRYQGVSYSHQGWVTEDQRFLLLDDEGDEQASGSNGRTKTYLFNIENLAAPRLIKVYEGPVVSIDHNLYIRGELAFLSNYQSGLRVLDTAGIAGSPSQVSEVAFLDTFIDNGASPTFDGLWSSYIYLPSGNLLLGSIEYGLIVARLAGRSLAPPPTLFPTSAPTQATASPTVSGSQPTTSPIGSATPFPSTSPTPFPSASGQPCVDIDNLRYSCSTYAYYGYCSYALVQESCQQSCGLCGSAARTLNECQDRSSSRVELASAPGTVQTCSALKSAELCSQPQVRNVCAGTCRACVDGELPDVDLPELKLNAADNLVVTARAPGQDEDTDPEGLSVGMVAGVCVGVAGVVGAAVAAVVVRRRRAADSKSGAEVADLVPASVEAANPRYGQV